MSNGDESRLDTTTTQLPPGQMDDETKQNILKAKEKTPRFLFRAWNNSTIFKSGGFIGLNTTNAVTPLAFFKESTKEDATIYDLTKTELQSMAKAHLRGHRSPMTQLSSWASTIKEAYRFARPHATSESCYIAVIDTHHLDNNNNVIIHVPLLSFLGVHGRHDYDFPHEYLAHGVIKGPAYQAVPITEFNKIGVHTMTNRLLSYPMRADNVCKPGTYPEITAEEFNKAKSVAKKYRENFVVPVTIAVLCLRKRDGDLWRCGNIKELELIAQGLREYRIPEDWCGEGSILMDAVYTDDYGEVKQMVHLLRALVNYWHGKGAERHRRPAVVHGHVHFPDEMEMDDDGRLEVPLDEENEPIEEVDDGDSNGKATGFRGIELGEGTISSHRVLRAIRSGMKTQLGAEDAQSARPPDPTCKSQVTWTGNVSNDVSCERTQRSRHNSSMNIVYAAAIARLRAVLKTATNHTRSHTTSKMVPYLRSQGKIELFDEHACLPAPGGAASSHDVDVEMAVTLVEEDIPDFDVAIMDPSSSKLRGQIDRLASRTPRFLFRGWGPKSGGDSRLNTVDAITPLAFLDQDGPRTIHHMSRAQLTDIANRHFMGAYTMTVFSSWSQSLAIAYSMMMIQHVIDDRPGYLSVINTDKDVLGAQNTILWTPEMSIIDNIIGFFPEEYLAFGKISGPGHKAVSFHDLKQHGIAMFTAPKHDEFLPLPTLVAKAIEIGGLFGESFTVPVVVALLTMSPRVQPDEILRALPSVSVRREWCEDLCIMAGHALVGPFEEASRTVKVLRGLVNRQYGRGVKRGVIEAAQDQEPDVQRTMPDEQPSAQEAIAASDRLPREVKALYIDMVGWTPEELEDSYRQALLRTY